MVMAWPFIPPALVHYPPKFDVICPNKANNES